jgi:PKD repeat protein
MLARFSRYIGFFILVVGLFAACRSETPTQPLNPDLVGVHDQDTVPPPINDSRDSARFAFPLPYDDIADISHATIEIGEPASSCDTAAGPASRSVWYVVTSHLSAPMTARVFDSTGVVAVYAVSFDSTGQVLSEVGCGVAASLVTFQADSGTSFYIQVYDYQDLGGTMAFHLEQENPPPPPPPPPPGPTNDNFANAELISGVPSTVIADFNQATREADEPAACFFFQPATVWYRFTAAETRAVVVSLQSQFFDAIAVYTGSSLNALSFVRCGHSFSGPIFLATAGTTYYIQLSADFGHTATLQLQLAPPPQANFGTFPFDPSIFDNVQFSDFSFDPAGIGIESRQWDLGDGTTATGFNVFHRYAADGDYQVSLTVRTVDGRTATISRQLAVRTRDVAIVRFATPSSGQTGKTSKITVDVRSTRYPETVQVQLFKSVPGGYQPVATSIQTLPTRNRVTSVALSYTFTPDDALIGKVTFRAVVTLVNGRDALPADNEAIGEPTRVLR